MQIINSHRIMQYSLMQSIFVNRTPDIPRLWFPRLLRQLVDAWLDISFIRPSCN
jgi:hypothetical protein